MCCCSEPSGPETSSRCCPLHGLSYPWVSGGNTVDVLTWLFLRRRLSWASPCEATPFLGDALARRRLSSATPYPCDAPSGQPVDFLSLLWGPRAVPPCVDFDFDFWLTPRDGVGRIWPARATIRGELPAWITARALSEAGDPRDQVHKKASRWSSRQRSHSSKGPHVLGYPKSKVTTVLGSPIRKAHFR